jgi:class 3 adenylate cyclase/tetratricopeptide (TPR) repeat protein
MSAYIPIDRQHALACGEPLPDRSTGAVVLADVSGFTPLTEALVRELGQQRGAEEITRQLNQVYTALIAEVDRYHGSVVGFSGDAITCWFDGDDDGLRATTCAVQMQLAMEPFSRFTLPTGSTLALAMKAAVAIGSVRRFVVGDPNVQLIDVLAGATLDRLAATEHQARKGEVVLAAEAARRLRSRIAIGAWRTDAAGEQFAVLEQLTSLADPQPWPAVGLNADLDRQVQHWLLPPVYERESSGQGAFLAELRPAVALFVRFDGIDYDADDAWQKLDGYVRWVQGILNRYEGFLLQLTIGDKGSYLYAAFGAPLAHEDDAARAMAAAQILRALPRGLNFITTVQIGVSQGRMRVGPCGSSRQRTYGVMGDEVNVAARLMQVATHAQVIVTKRVADQAAQRFQFRPLGEVSVKGKQEPIPIFELVDRRGGALDIAGQDRGSAPPLVVGRADERSILTAHFWKLLSARTSGLVLVSGEAGIGKTRLIDDLRAEACALNVTTLNGAGDAIERSTPYYAWRAVFNRCLRLDALPDDVDVRRQHALEALASDLETLRVAPLLNAVLPLDLPDNDLTVQMTGQVRADNTHTLLTRLLQRLAANEPLLLLLEDAHWLDSASWALTLAVSRTVQPLLMVISTRPLSGPPPADYQQLLDTPNLARIDLDSMSAGEISHLICYRLGVKALPEQVDRLIMQKAEGNPFFSEELAFALRDTGLITVAEGECRIAPHVDFRTIAFPDTVQGVITSRIDRLAPPQQMTLKAASVVGRVFAYRILRDIHPIDSERLHLPEYLDTLQRLDLTALESLEPELSYLFKHALTQEVAYNLMLFAQRRELHRAVARWYERTFADDLTAHYSLLAYHWQQAEDIHKAIEYMEKSGEQALRSGASREAITVFNRALELAAAYPDRYDLVRRAYWERQIGEAYMGIGNVPEAYGNFQLALKHLNRPMPTTRAGVMLGITTQMTRQFLHRMWPARFIGRSRNRSVDSEFSRIYVTVAQIAYYQNDKLLLLYDALNNLNFSEGLGPSSELARAYAGTSILCGVIPLHDLANQYQRLAEQIIPTLERTGDIAHINEFLGTYQAGLRLAAAAECFEYAIKVFAEIGDQRLWEESTTLLSMTLKLQGQLDRSLTLRENMLTIGLQRNNVQVQTWALLGLAEIAVLRHELPAAIDHLQHVQAFSEKLGLEDAVWMYGLLARAQWRLGQIDLARDAAERGAAIAAKATPVNFNVVEGYAGIAEVYLNLWEIDVAYASAARKTIKQLSRYAHVFPIAEARALLMQGRAAWLSGKQKDAKALWQKGLAAAEQRQLPYDRGLLLEAIGRHAPPGDVAREENLQQALNVFSDLRAAYDFDRARAELMRSETAK